MATRKALGIDWATKPRDRARVTIERLDGKLTVTDVTRGVPLTDLKKLMARQDLNVIAVDIPFGWPRGFSDFVKAWTPKAPREVPGDKAFRRRETDDFVHETTSKAPMAVSADKFAMGARLWAELVRKNGWGKRVDLDGSLRRTEPAPIIEVYPGAALFQFGLREAYKDSDKRAVRERFAKAMARDFKVAFKRPSAASSVAKNDDELDAFVAALTGMIYLDELSDWEISVPTGKRVGLAKREGWIFFPLRKE